MDAVNPLPLTSTVAFRLGTLGSLVSARFAEAVDAHGLKPKDVGLLAVLEAGGGASQLELARTMRVAPSLLVTLADRLEALEAVQRVRDPQDRRRQNVVITEHGRTLLAACTAATHELDAELTADLGERDRAALRRVLAALAVSNGLPG